MKTLLNQKSCPISGLPILNKQEWRYQGFGGGYSVSVCLIGGRYLFSYPIGYATLSNLKGALDLTNRIIEEYLPTDQTYIRIEDYSELKGVSLDARKYFIDYLRKNQRIFAVIFSNTSQLLRLSIKLAKRLHVVSFKVEISKDYESAINLARNLLPLSDIATSECPENIITGQIAEVEKEKEAQSNSSIQQYTGELLQFLAGMNWESEKSDISPTYDKSHPLKPVYDAISLIKSDIDDLLFLQRVAQANAKESEDKYRIILESIQDGYYEVDLKGNLTFFNPALSQLYGYSPEELVGMNSREYMDKKNAREILEVFGEVYKTGKPNNCFVHDVITKGGNRLCMELSVSLVKDRWGKSVGFQGITRDITERMRMADLQKAKIEAEAASMTKSGFLANISHEIRTPLNGIIGMSELALEDQTEENVYENLRTIKQEANSLLQVINQVLDFSKIEAEKMELEKIPFNLGSLLEDIAYAISISAKKKNLQLMSFLNLNVPRQLIGDPGRLRQILVNLAGNAIKFTEQGEIFIKGELKNSSKNKITVRFSIRDTGIGIPKEKQKTIFESFTQADGSTTRKYGGTGLGTTISKQLANLMGGEIGLESEVGKGSTFWFDAQFTLQEIEYENSLQNEIGLLNKKILIIAGNETHRNILHEYLDFWKCRPFEESDNEKAMNRLMESTQNQDPFDLILADFQVTNEEYFTFLKRIKHEEALKKIPIVLLTSIGQMGDGKKCIRLGIEGYLKKPIKQNELEEVIKTVLHLAQKNESPKTKTLVTRHSISENLLKDVRVLLVEDYPTNQKIAMKFLEKAGFDVDLAENGQKALDMVKRIQYDVILMDIQMPVMDGYKATSEIRDLEEKYLQSSAKSSRIPIIAMTAHAMDGYKEKCLKAGMDDYISKPLNRDLLIELVHRWRHTGSKILNESPIISSQPKNHSQSTEKKSVIPPLDLKQAVLEFEGDEAFLFEVMEGFIENVKKQLISIHKALNEGDAELIRHEAHSIKGGAANLTATNLAKLAYALEKTGISEDLTSADTILINLEKEFNSLDNYIQETIKNK